MTEALDPRLTEKLDGLRALLRSMEDVLVTFSGGVDSALVLKVAVDTLGDRALALTADSPTFPPEECAEARRFAAEIGARHLVVAAHELEREGYAKNAGDRCYFCKTELFDLARDTAAARGIRWILDGTIVDDLGGHRPGLKAAAEHEVRHPLVEAGFTKADVRAAAKALGMPVWDKPSFACLGSRFAVGTRVTLGRVTRVGRIESALRVHGFRQFRVRFHELGGSELLRIEVEIGELARLVAPGVRDDIVAACRAEGFSWITLDLEGYRTGSTSGAHPSVPSASETASTTSPPAHASGSSRS
ncbi:MAG: ATP-dependent sacrificial sulfur transferase LarE [Pseudomonadota bacterium]|nr:ATP-dependent sacrificial sulfur transferase LarE [Pseudomonadota bacterium]